MKELEKEQTEISIRRKKINSYFAEEFSFNRPKNKMVGRWR